MQRHRPLRADPEKVRAFLARGRGKLKRQSELKRSAIAAKRKVAPNEGPLTPAEWHRQVFAASGGTCIVSSSRARGADDENFHAHHIIAAQQLRKRGLHGRVWDARNGLWVANAPHMAHEHTGGSHRIARELLPAAAWAFAAELDALAGTQWASAYLERMYPAAGTRRSQSPRRTDAKERD